MQYELILTTGKKVIVREPKIKDQDLAASAVAGKAGENSMSFAMHVQTEVIKQLIISVDGKVLSGQDKEKLDNHFSFQEYSELQLGIKDILGEVKKPQISLVKENCGDK
jgi:hypothetical protein